MQLKEQQPSMNVDQQIENLKMIGLRIVNEEYARRILNDISYFRLIKAYGLGLKGKNKNFDGSISFEQIVELYLFNANFRQLLFTWIEQIEVNLRCRVANHFSHIYGVLGYEDPDNFNDPGYHYDFLCEIKKEISRNSKAPFVKNFKNNYIDGKIPFYALVELFSFGTLSKFYKNMKPQDKKPLQRCMAWDILILKAGSNTLLLCGIFVHTMDVCIMLILLKRQSYISNIQKRG